MRFHCVVLLVAAAFGSSGNATTITADTRLSLRDQVVDTSPFPKSFRALRGRASPTDNEERGTTDAITKILLTSDDITKLTNGKLSSEALFQKLRLHEIVKKEDGIENMIEGLKRAMTQNPNLKQFGYYLSKTPTKNTIEELLPSLIFHYGDNVVAKMLFKAQLASEGEDKLVLQIMQGAQYLKWYKEQKTVEDIDVLLRVRHENDAYAQILREYGGVLDAFIKTG
ncbi:RxLR effector protein [Phytophthora megakarya]|uniref:RxLR effector protein n=1 Tax=Phytophthora megakarya TaxID=4795 RepID=A0A225WZZ0_9STRA|nr:RxLR effector protein [Phytophthora megakarya]